MEREIEKEREKRGKGREEEREAEIEGKRQGERESGEMEEKRREKSFMLFYWRDVRELSEMLPIMRTDLRSIFSLNIYHEKARPNEQISIGVETGQQIYAGGRSRSRDCWRSSPSLLPRTTRYTGSNGASDC
eukprot:1343906-Amorphochlora_amoeboformis.AAC.1